jgi:hypothetical protein
MRLAQHRRLAGSLLIAFAIMNFGVCSVIVSKLSELNETVEPDRLLLIFFWSSIVAVSGTMVLLAAQLVAGFKMLREGPGLYKWALAGSIIAIVCGISLPAGVYSLWVTLKSNRENLV